MAVQTVSCEPVSGRIYLLNREDTGKFTGFGLQLSISHQTNC